MSETTRSFFGTDLCHTRRASSRDREVHPGTSAARPVETKGERATNRPTTEPSTSRRGQEERRGGGRGEGGLPGARQEVHPDREGAREGDRERGRGERGREEEEEEEPSLCPKRLPHVTLERNDSTTWQERTPVPLFRGIEEETTKGELQSVSVSPRGRRGGGRGRGGGGGGGGKTSLFPGYITHRVQCDV